MQEVTEANDERIGSSSSERIVFQVSERVVMRGQEPVRLHGCGRQAEERSTRRGAPPRGGNPSCNETTFVCFGTAIGAVASVAFACEFFSRLCINS